VLQAKSAVSAAEPDRKQLEQQSQDVSQAIEAATAALQDLQRQIRAAEVGARHTVQHGPLLLRMHPCCDHVAHLSRTCCVYGMPDGVRYLSARPKLPTKHADLSWSACCLFCRRSWPRT
jgi:hypothetical protein